MTQRTLVDSVPSTFWAVMALVSCGVFWSKTAWADGDSAHSTPAAEESLVEVHAPATCGDDAALLGRLERESRGSGVDSIRIVIDEGAGGYQLRVHTRHGQCDRDRLAYTVNSCEEAIELSVFTVHLLIEETERSRCDAANAPEVDVHPDPADGATQGASLSRRRGTRKGNHTRSSAKPPGRSPDGWEPAWSAPGDRDSNDSRAAQTALGGSDWLIAAGGAVSTQSASDGDVGTTAELDVDFGRLRLLLGGTWWLPNVTREPLPITWARITASMGVCRWLASGAGDHSRASAALHRAPTAGEATSGFRWGACARGHMNVLSASTSAAGVEADLEAQWASIGVSLLGQIRITDGAFIEVEPNISYVPHVPDVMSAEGPGPYRVGRWETGLVVRLSWQVAAIRPRAEEPSAARQQGANW